ncbi:GLPGLI family protein [Flavobacterium sp. NST-5]|uniref:GLPGLI family protein n=1 Tax=Flavobacterium ichthyis TaxID=2698827 RepID=A0ABW9Z8V4_9FLAO|nr:GLPGLI family protein [Flavobacterium ichthyis]NBL63777.1 GLPGLI family protein [Flavobacterium ichthyis]
MIRALYYLAIFSITAILNIAFAQDFQGQAIYESKTQMKDKVKIKSSDMTPEMIKSMEEQMVKMFEKTYVLNFNKTESVFTQEEKLETPIAGENSVMFKGGSDGISYVNVKEKLLLVFEDRFGKEFTIADSLPNWNWKIESETKKIGNYLCTKATATVPPSAKAMNRFKEQQAKKANGETMIFSMGEPKEQIHTVWFTPEIPVSLGPKNYWGLPGLILEANNGSTIYLCSKIILNPKEKTEIKRPNKGKKVSREEYVKILEKQLERMTDSKGNINIQVGG